VTYRGRMLGSLEDVMNFDLLCSACGKVIPTYQTCLINYELDKAWHLKCRKENIPEQ
jgi:hypothetical protein